MAIEIDAFHLFLSLLNQASVMPQWNRIDMHYFSQLNKKSDESESIWSEWNYLNETKQFMLSKQNRWLPWHEHIFLFILCNFTVIKVDEFWCAWQKCRRRECQMIVDAILIVKLVFVRRFDSIFNDMIFYTTTNAEISQ